MSVEEFYDGPCRLAVAYKRAHRIRREQANFDAYLQGAYVHEALLRAAPAFNPFSKAKPMKWLDKPYELRTTTAKSDPDGTIGADKAEEKPNAAIAFMQAFAAKHNANLAKRKASAAADGQGEPPSD